MKLLLWIVSLSVVTQLEALGIHTGSTGPCHNAGGACIDVPISQNVTAEMICPQDYLIDLDHNELMGECGSHYAICCKVGRVRRSTGPCRDAGGACIDVPISQNVTAEMICPQDYLIDLDHNELMGECGSHFAICCKVGRVRRDAKRVCDVRDTPKKCRKLGAICMDECNTLEIEGLCEGASCTCCLKESNPKKCKPKKEYEDLHGFCIRNTRACEVAGGTVIEEGCECGGGIKKPRHLCYKDDHEEFHWSYKGETGPDYWADHFPICGMERQSPIDIISADADDSLTAEPFELFLYDREPSSMDITNNGHSVTCYWNYPISPFIENGDLDSLYTLAQFHFHWGSNSAIGSEHLIDGQAYPIELHLVHYKAEYGSLGEAIKYDDGLAVLGVMFELGDENPALTPLVEALQYVQEPGMEHTIDEYPVPLDAFLPDNTNSFYRYLGSLTTPTCNEVVVWTVFKEPNQISEEQLAEFRNLLDHEDDLLVDNFRPVQNLHGRTVYNFEV